MVKRSISKKVLMIMAATLVGLLIWNFEMIRYGINQGTGQFEVIWNAEPIEELLQDEQFPDSTKQKLRYTMKVKTFAIEQLGLYDSDNYSTYYDQKGVPILWNLSASDKYELNPYLWKYPLLGSMPYKGFFDLEKAFAEQKEFITKGYDTRIRTVGGWSTLGILSDPILSNMLDRSEGQLAEVIIHELVHATLFIKNEVDFNENLASFIGEKGAVRFLKYHFGDSSAALQYYLEEEHDHKLFIRHILHGTKRLDSLYQAFQNEPIVLKDSLKQDMIQSIVSGVDNLNFHQDKYLHLFDEALPNNAYFLSFIRYHSKEDSLHQIYSNYNHDLKAMISDMKATHGK